MVVSCCCEVVNAVLQSLLGVGDSCKGVMLVHTVPIRYRHLLPLIANVLPRSHCPNLSSSFTSFLYLTRAKDVE